VQLLDESIEQPKGMTADELAALLRALVLLRNGDATARLPVEWTGVAGKVADVFNQIAELNQWMTSELARLSRDVGSEGRLSQRAGIGDRRGFWRDSLDSVNALITDLVYPTTETARVIGAVAQGDLSQTMALDIEGRPLRGEFLHTAKTINRMVAQLGSFASEVTRVAREVGTDGKLGGQAKVKSVAGTWKDLTDSVNSMAGNLTGQVRNIAEVTTAVATGDLSKKITVDVKGEFLELKNTINTMVDQLRSFAAEVTRVAHEVGTEGKLGGQARVEGVSGTWKDLTDSVNFMASNLTSQVRNIALVTTAVANGNLSKKITVDVKGEILELKNTVNTMVDQLSSFASEVTRVAREVGTEGKLGGQADVRGVAGTWKDLTDSVNSMAGNLTAQVRNIAEVTTAVALGDLSKKITVDVKGEILELKNTINTMVDQLRSFAAEVTRVAREVGTEGNLGGQAKVEGVSGTWRDLTDGVNSMAGNLTAQVRNIAEVTTAVANGDLSKKITVDVRGEILELKDTINTMVDQLSSFASEVTRVAREVGTEGKLGGQADVKDVSGTWKDLTDNVNSMASNLTGQVRGIAKIVTAVANGDLQLKLTVDAKGEIAAVTDTINGMIETLATFADQVTTVAREVGVEGKLGGQAKVPGASGTWKNLTENVNQLAANLTTQVRAIAEVANAVTKGDLTRSITVDTRGEVAALKDTINEMIRNLRDSTQKNTEQDWLKTNLAKFSRMLQGQRDLTTVGRLILSELAPVVSAQHAEFYVLDTSHGSAVLKLLASYAADGQSEHGRELELGQGLVGQCAIDKEKIVLGGAGHGFIRIASGLGESLPHTILVLPVIFEGQLRGVIELASLDSFTPMHHAFLDQLMESIGIVLNTIQGNMRTEDLLSQSQLLAQELQQTNSELQEKALLLAHQNEEVERKNSEVEQARQALEEKAKQLALTSKYKSEFLANMSHELRTPLNSLLILSDQLSRNSDGNLNAKQTEFAKTIHSSGTELLALINDILDLSKIESGTVVLDIGEVGLDELHQYMERTFRHVAESKNLEFLIEMDRGLPRSITTDAKRLQQVLKNLLSNAFKFTHQGRVTLSIERAVSGWSPDNDQLNRAGEVLALSVTDTGIGIPHEKQQIVFEAFQQADGSTNRRFGGTGLGLAISRELSRLLGGEVRLVSAPQSGSTFTLFLPLRYVPHRPVRKGPAGGDPLESRADLLKTVAIATTATPPGDAQLVTDVPLLREPEAEDSEYQLPNGASDDRDTIRPDDRVVLIIENDLGFARVMLDAMRARGFKGLVTPLGAAALTMIREHNVDLVTLDILLPDIEGWRVLARLKNDLSTRHIPICVISTEESRDRALQSGALAFVEKPIRSLSMLDQVCDQLHRSVNRQERTLLIVAAASWRDDGLEAMHQLPWVNVTRVHDPSDMLPLPSEHVVDAILIVPEGLDFDDARLAQFVGQWSHGRGIPIIISGEVTRLGRASRSAIERAATVRRVISSQRLLDQVTLALHLNLNRLPEADRASIENLYVSDKCLADRHVLIVDDDMRNIFALATVLEEHRMNVRSADNGHAAIRMLQEHADIDIVLMDIMMPEMDGLATMRAIRKVPRLHDLPIVAVTAKAMRGDRDKCIAAGAWDYLAKPVDIEQLLHVLRAWLLR
jgi:HAMP domain-containing protein/signal transduction histidine kinase/CheY-like chemotaxis protein